MLEREREGKKKEKSNHRSLLFAPHLPLRAERFHALEVALLPFSGCSRLDLKRSREKQAKRRRGECLVRGEREEREIVV